MLSQNSQYHTLCKTVTVHMHTHPLPFSPSLSFWLIGSSENYLNQLNFVHTTNTVTCNIDDDVHCTVYTLCTRVRMCTFCELYIDVGVVELAVYCKAQRVLHLFYLFANRILMGGGWGEEWCGGFEVGKMYTHIYIYIISAYKQV